MSPTRLCVQLAVAVVAFVAAPPAQARAENSPAHSSASFWQDTTRRDTSAAARRSRSRMRVSKDASSAARADTGARTSRRSNRSGMRVQKEGAGNAGGGVSRDSANAMLERARQDSINRINQARQDSINAAQAAAAAAERARQDSIARVEQARRDSIARVEQARRDSIARVEQMRRDSIARADSIAKAQAMSGVGFAIGAGGGISLPMGAAKDRWDNGWNGFVMVGYDWPGWLGIRVDGTYDNWKSKTNFGYTYDDAKQYGVNADLKVRVPLMQGSPNISIYGLAGGTYAHFDFGNYITGSSSGLYSGTNTNLTQNKFGWNAGGGLSFGWSPWSVFVEGRYQAVSVDAVSSTEQGLDKVQWVPVVIGISYTFH
jgi:hypothetical protein